MPRDIFVKIRRRKNFNRRGKCGYLEEIGEE